MFFIQYGCSSLDTNASFRLPWGIQMLPAVVLLIAIPFLPRSPRWLASKDRMGRGHRSFGPAARERQPPGSFGDDGGARDSRDCCVCQR